MIENRRLTIDEVIEHCKRHTAQIESRLSREDIESIPVENSTMLKQYWEHRQVAEWLEELKKHRQDNSHHLLQESLLNVGDIVYIISRGVIIPLEITSVILDSTGVHFSASNTEHFGYGTVMLNADKSVVPWYTTAQEAASDINSRCTFNSVSCQKFCGDCAYLDMTQPTGHKHYVCTNSTRERHDPSRGLGHTKKVNTPACKTGFKSKDAPDFKEE